MGFFDLLRSIFGGDRQPGRPGAKFLVGINENITEFYGMPVRDFDPAVGIAEPAEVIYRLSLGWDADDKGVTFDGTFQAYVNSPNASKPVGLVIGNWGHGDGAEDVVKAIAAAGNKVEGAQSPVPW